MLAHYLVGMLIRPGDLNVASILFAFVRPMHGGKPCYCHEENKLHSPRFREESTQETAYKVKEGLISKKCEGGIGVAKRE